MRVSASGHTTFDLPVTASQGLFGTASYAITADDIGIAAKNEIVGFIIAYPSRMI